MLAIGPFDRYICHHAHNNKGDRGDAGADIGREARFPAQCRLAAAGILRRRHRVRAGARRCARAGRALCARRRR
ncbi:hypothetical protein CA830_29730, partial [Burkholderia multivorans]